MQNYLLLAGIACYLAALPWRKFYTDYLLKYHRNQARIAAAEAEAFIREHYRLTRTGDERYMRLGWHPADELFVNELIRCWGDTEAGARVQAWVRQNWTQPAFKVEPFKVTDTPSPIEFSKVEYFNEEWEIEEKTVG